ncbi:MAG: hypothetical protein IPN86_16660 [Saprospiraceae bacterium]|nr:hypothetical protein [Saprospiraceae bacterium]
MKKLVLFFYFLSFSILGFSQNKMKLPNGITIIEVINQSGTTSYSATNSTGQSVPVKVVNAKKLIRTIWTSLYVARNVLLSVMNVEQVLHENYVVVAFVVLMLERKYFLRK